MVWLNINTFNLFSLFFLGGFFCGHNVQQFLERALLTAGAVVAECPIISWLMAIMAPEDNKGFRMFVVSTQPPAGCTSHVVFLEHGSLHLNASLLHFSFQPQVVMSGKRQL